MESVRMDLDTIYNEVKTIFDYMSLNQKVKKCDVIIGCGCSSKNIPIVCSNLYKQGFSDKIIFAGGYGKVTKDMLRKQESILYKEIAMKEGVKESDIYLDTKSSNTMENFLFSKKILEENDWDIHSILVVHNKSCERRTLNTAKKVFPDKEIIITSKDVSFDEYFDELKQKPKEYRDTIISVLVGNIQRMMIYPQFGLQVEDKVPKEVNRSYRKLKSLGFDKDILSKDEINSIASQHGVNREDILYFE